jgi:hypothetical protein
MTIIEFAAKFPHYSFDFDKPISLQPRVYDQSILQSLPEELASSHEYRGGGRGRPNLNQTLAHSQCKTCKRVLRNDFFYTPPSRIRGNGVYTHCLSCSQQQSATRYSRHASSIRNRRGIIWRYLAPRCYLCGFDKHMSAMDIHHLGAKETEIASLITEVTLVPDIYRAEKLLREVSACIALCSNCHRMLHAGAIQLPRAVKPLPYNLAELMQLLKTGNNEEQQHDETE